MSTVRRPPPTRQAHDLKSQQQLVLQVPGGASGVPEEIRITLDHKSGRAARLVIEASPSVNITRKT